jgi:T-complex protein 1 subunit delta
VSDATRASHSAPAARPPSRPAPGQAQELLAKGVHPTVVSDAFSKAVAKANEVLEGIATPVDLTDKEALVRAANT